jgi:uncharacterized heparinase superfamily protein
MHSLIYQLQNRLRSPLSPGLGGWLFNKPHIPDRVIVKPVDLWPGCSISGNALLDGAFTIGQQRLSFGGLVERAAHWTYPDLLPVWASHVHGFSWLRDLRAVGGPEAREFTRTQIETWIYHHREADPIALSPAVMGERLAMWLSHYDFFSDEEPDFLDIFFESVILQALALSKSNMRGAYSIGALKAGRGLLYAGLAFEGRETLIEQALDYLKAEVNLQILEDGGHISRRPENILNSLQIMLDIRSALAAAGYPLPGFVQYAIDRLTPALKFFRYSDKKLAVFNGTQEGHIALIDTVLAQAAMRTRAMNSLPKTGYERLSQGRTLLLMDVGQSPYVPYDENVHAAPLAFEMCYGRERVFVSCGHHPTDPSWQAALRSTAAHNTVTLDNRNACEIGPDGHFTRRVQKTSHMREDSKHAILIEASHDGYCALNGITHRRRIYMGEQGCDIRGEDQLSCHTGLTHEISVAVRFHIHPRVMVSTIQDGSEALLRLPNGVGWRFCLSGGALELDNSIYLGEGTRPRKTKQLVITAPLHQNHHTIKWAIQREGVQKQKHVQPDMFENDGGASR